MIIAGSIPSLIIIVTSFMNTDSTRISEGTKYNLIGITCDIVGAVSIFVPILQFTKFGNKPEKIKKSEEKASNWFFGVMSIVFIITGFSLQFYGTYLDGLI